MQFRIARIRAEQHSLCKKCKTLCTEGISYEIV
jgi:hypothetical protein